MTHFAVLLQTHAQQCQHIYFILFSLTTPKIVSIVHALLENVFIPNVVLMEDVGKSENAIQEKMKR